MMEEKEINLDNPIFTYYINIGGLSRQRAEETLSEISKSFNYQNVTIWIVPIQQGDSRIECVYDGRIRERSEELKSLIEELNEKVDILSRTNSFEDFKIEVRDWRLKNLFK
jgi:hypothetical protein